MFELVSDMSGVRGTAKTALELHAQIPMRGSLKSKGLFVVHNGKQITQTAFKQLCAIETLQRDQAEAISGWKTLVDWFGYSPDFHDAEVLTIDLRRDPEPSTVRIHLWRTNSDTDDKGYFRQDRHAIVTFKIQGIRSLKLEGWNHQNVLSGLWVDRADENYVLHLPEIYGVDGEIVAAAISVGIEPFQAE